VSEAKRNERLVICNYVDSNRCPDKCPHKKAHDPIHDCYSFDDKGQPEGKYCNTLESSCGWREIEGTICD